MTASSADRLDETSLLQMMAWGRPACEVLNAVCRSAEAALLGWCAVCAIDWSAGRIVDIAAAGLPVAFAQSLMALPLTPESGPCGRAASLKVPVVTEDVESDILWQDCAFYPLAVAHGVRSCWSVPVGPEGGQVLGTLVIFRAEPGRPNPTQESAIARLSHIAGIVLAKSRVESSVATANADLARLVEAFTVGATLASDITQPLSGVAINASAGLRMLAGSPPDVTGAQETIRRTLRDCSRASETVARLRTLLSTTGSRARPQSGPPSAG